jgi:CRP-like cAMP-binding protein
MRSRHDSWVATYRAMPLFAECSRSELRLATGVATRLVVPRGTVLARQGAQPSAFVIVMDGVADVRRDGRPIEVIATGGHFGEISLVRGICEPVTVVARTDVTVDVVGRREFRSLYSLVDGVRTRVDHELDRRVARWITPRSTVVADADLALTG